MTTTLAPLRHRPFQLLVTGRVITTLGNGVAPIALAFAVLDLTGSITSLGLVVGTRSAVNVLFVLFGGVLADRMPGSAVLVGSSLLSAITQAMVAGVVLTDTASVPLLMALSAFNGAASAFALPASSSLVPQTVPAPERQQANALVRLSRNGPMILGYTLGGVLVAAVGPGWGLAVDAASFLLSGLCFLLIRVPPRTPTSRRPGRLSELREGWTAFASRPWLWIVVAAYMVVNAASVAGVLVLGPKVADAAIGRSAWGVVLSAQGIGMVVGAFVAARLRTARLLLTGVVCVAAKALLPLVLALRPTLLLLVLAAFVGGLCVEQFVVAWDTSLQEHIPADKLGRVYSYDIIGSIVAVPIAEMAVGPLTDEFGLRGVLLGSATLILLATAAMVGSQSVRRLEHRPARQEPEAAPVAT